MIVENWCDEMIAAARGMYGGDASIYYRRGLCVERDWDEQGNLRTDERRPYTRVRFVKTYDASQYFLTGSWIETGIRAEVW